MGIFFRLFAARRFDCHSGVGRGMFGGGAVDGMGYGPGVAVGRRFECRLHTDYGRATAGDAFFADIRVLALGIGCSVDDFDLFLCLSDDGDQWCRSLVRVAALRLDGVDLEPGASIAFQSGFFIDEIGVVSVHVVEKCKIDGRVIVGEPRGYVGDTRVIRLGDRIGLGVDCGARADADIGWKLELRGYVGPRGLVDCLFGILSVEVGRIAYRGAVALHAVDVDGFEIHVY